MAGGQGDTGDAVEAGTSVPRTAGVTAMCELGEGERQLWVLFFIAFVWYVFFFYFVSIHEDLLLFWR